MAHRPHFAYQTPAGYVDERAEFPFDYRNAPSFNSASVPYLQYMESIPLRLDADAEFRWRGISWEYPDPGFFYVGQIAIRLRDAYGNYLSSDFIPILNYAQAYHIMQPWNDTGGLNNPAPPSPPTFVSPFVGGMAVPFADEIICPASSVLWLDIQNLNRPFQGCSVGRFMVRGVKRRPAADCASDFR
jgi:hypothetical protein